MKQLNKISDALSNFEWHKRVVQSKQDPCRSNIAQKESEIRVCIENLETAAASQTLSTITPNLSCTSIKEELHSCFSGKTKQVKAIFSEVKDSQNSGVLKWCPYCGITKPNSHDHYLPKETFPEFSITPLNLVNCCTTCNSSKGELWLNESNQRYFIHYYSDTIPETQYLKVSLTSIGDAYAATYTLEQPNTVNNNDWELIVRHYTKLDLLQKYKDNTNDEIVEILDNCVAHIEDGGGSARSFLRRMANAEQNRFGTNHWRSILKLELANNQSFTGLVATAVQ